MDFSKSLPITEAETTVRLQKMLPNLLEGFSISDIRRERRIGDRISDMTMKIRVGAAERVLVVEVKQIGEPRLIRDAISQIREIARNLPGAYPVIGAPYLTESSRQLCKEAGVGYIDLSGNVYIRFDNVLIERSTPVALRRERKSLRGLGAPKASRVIRTLLGQPKRPFQVTELAKVSGVSPAEVYKVATLLELKGLAQRNRERRLILSKPGDLLDAWASSVDFKKNRIFPTYSSERSPEAIARAIATAAETGKREYALTSFYGAFLVAPAVRFYDVACYVSGDIEWWLERLDVKEVDSGSNLQIVLPKDDGVFADAQEAQGFRVVSDIQLYADLINNPARGREAASAVRERRIKW